MSFTVKRSMLGSDTVASVHSPISGRVVYISDPFDGGTPQNRTNPNTYFFLLEMPKNERYAPPHLSRAFRRFSEVIWEHRSSLLKKSHDGSFPNYSDGEIEGMLRKLCDTEPVVISKSEGDYQQRIDSLNVHYPHGIGRGR